MSKEITRKHFIKNFGLATLSAPGLLAFSGSDILSGNKGNEKRTENYEGRDQKEWITIRGSWVRKGNALPGDIVLTSAGKGCQIVVDAKEHTAVHRAAKFLAADIEKISGFRPPLVEKPGKSTRIRIATLGQTNIPKEIDTADINGKWESYKIVTLNDEVWLIGANFRGTAFAIYTLCERLGIDPLYIWTGFHPEHQTVLIMKKTLFYTSSPTFKYRGYFHDDEDILPRPFEMSGYPLRVGDVDLEWYQRYFETALRLRMNMVAPYTRVHRRYEVQKCAAEWGLFYTSHHYDILLSNPFGIERFNLARKRGINPQWDWFKNRDGMVKYWRGGVWENKELPCIWPVGLRGTNDYGYPFPKGTSEKEQTKVFNDVINTQINTVKELLPCNAAPPFALTLYTEMLDKYQSQKSEFNLPEDVMIIWPDNNNGEMRALPSQLGKWKHGVYYHLAYYGMDLHKQGTHIVSPQTVGKQFREIVKSGATEFLLVNVSEMRDYMMEARMVAEISWDAPSILESNDPGLHYIKWWSNEYFGPDNIENITGVYRQYYELLDEPKKLWLGADMVRTLLRSLVKKFKGEMFEPLNENDIQLLQQRNKQYQSVMELISSCSKKMSRNQKQYFFENTQLGLSFDWRPTQAALLLHKALLENDKQKAWHFIEEAYKPLEQLEMEILQAERPPFDKWYRETWIRGKLSSLNVHRSYELVRAFISSGGRVAQPPKGTGHDNVAQSKIWTRFLEDSETLNDPLSLP